MAEERKPGDVVGRPRAAVDRNTGDFGSTLREARERKGISLREIANATKISVRALEALERNDISHLPGGIFSRAFVRSYAAEAGLNPDQTVDDFVRQFPHESVTAGHPPSAHIDDGDGFESNRRTASVVLRLVAISVPVGAIVLYFGIANRRSPAVSSQPVSAVATTKAEPSSTVPAATAFDRTMHLSIELIANRACSVTATIDGQSPIEMRIESGGRRTLEAANELLLTISDPAAIEWRINGMPGRGLGPAGTAATARLTLDNYKDFLATR
jgi:transcriptional regulator with XRE-family HTH domain